METDM